MVLDDELDNYLPPGEYFDAELGLVVRTGVKDGNPFMEWSNPFSTDVLEITSVWVDYGDDNAS